MFSVFSHTNILGKKTNPLQTPCEARTFRGTKAPTLTALKEENDKNGLCVAREGNTFSLLL